MIFNARNRLRSWNPFFVWDHETHSWNPFGSSRESDMSERNGIPGDLALEMEFKAARWTTFDYNTIHVSRFYWRSSSPNRITRWNGRGVVRKSHTFQSFELYFFMISGNEIPCFDIAFDTSFTVMTESLIFSDRRYSVWTTGIIWRIPSVLIPSVPTQESPSPFLLSAPFSTFSCLRTSGRWTPADLLPNRNRNTTFQIWTWAVAEYGKIRWQFRLLKLSSWNSIFPEHN